MNNSCATKDASVSWATHTRVLIGNYPELQLWCLHHLLTMILVHLQVHCLLYHVCVCCLLCVNCSLCVVDTGDEVSEFAMVVGNNIFVSVCVFAEWTVQLFYIQTFCVIS